MGFGSDINHRDSLEGLNLKNTRSAAPGSSASSRPIEEGDRNRLVPESEDQGQSLRPIFDFFFYLLTEKYSTDYSIHHSELEQNRIA